MTSSASRTALLAALAVPALGLAACASSGSSPQSAPPAGGPPAPPNSGGVPQEAEPANPGDPASWETAEYANQAGLALINAAAGYAARTTGLPGGEGVRVAIIDAGIDASHPDLVDAVVQSVVIDADGAPYTDHGTHVAGIVGARRSGRLVGNTADMHGVAYRADLVDIEAGFSSGGAGVSDIFFEDAAIAAAVASAAGNAGVFGSYTADPTAEADIMNLSLGGGGSNLTTRNAMRAAAADGKIMVVAAGNTLSGPAGADPLFPAGHATDAEIAGFAIVAVNLQADGSIHPQSNRCGQAAQYCLGAPGVDIISTITEDRYGISTGTSMAAPTIAGAAAVVMAAFPGVAPDEVVQRLLLSGTNAATGPDAITGWGMLQLDVAMEPMGQTMAMSEGSFVGVGASLGGDGAPLGAASVGFGPAIGDPLAGSALAGRAVVFDEMGFPFAAELETRVRRARRPSRVAALAAPPQDVFHVAGGVGSPVRYVLTRTYDAPLDAWSRAEARAPRVSGRATARLAPGVRLHTAFAEPARAEPGLATSHPTDAMAAAARPFAAFLGRKDAAGLAVDLPFGFTASAAYERSSPEARDFAWTAPSLAARDAFAPDPEEGARLAAVSLHGVAVERENASLSFTGGWGVLDEDAGALGGASSGAFALGGAQTRFVNAGLSARLRTVSLSAAWTAGETETGSSERLFEEVGAIRSSAFAAGLAAPAFGGRAGLTVRRDLAARAGSATLAFATGRTEEGAVLFERERASLAADMPIALEAEYARRLKGPFDLRAAAYHETGDGAEETGLALRLSALF